MFINYKQSIYDNYLLNSTYFQQIIEHFGEWVGNGNGDGSYASFYVTDAAREPSPHICILMVDKLTEIR